jgi:hypothetical protein
MYHIDRSSVPIPEIYGSPELQQEFERLRGFYEQQAEQGLAQARSPLEKRIPLREQLLAGVLDLFAGKCAYCEQFVGRPTKGDESLPPKLDFFRPHSEAIGLKGDTAPDHYWWLAFEWENHHLACASCIGYKRSQFPVFGERLDYNPRQRVFKRDKGLLLDPCNDVPHMWLEFTPDGKVAPAAHPSASTRRAWGDYDRGDMTIQILNLNRTPLLDSRLEIAGQLEGAWRRFHDSPDAKTVASVESYLSSDAPHVGMSRQLVARFLLTDMPSGAAAKKAAGPLRDAVSDELATLRRRGRMEAGPATARKAARGVRKAKHAEMEQRGIAREAEELEGSEPDTPPSFATVRIEQVSLKNYKAIHNLTLDFNENGNRRITVITPEGEVEEIETRAAWKMLLGENGTGKSTVLEAIASTLLGPRLLDDGVQEALGVLPGKVLRRGSRFGWVRIKFQGDPTEWELRFTKTGYRFPNGAPVLSTFVRGYGATRLLPGRSQRTEDPTDGERVDVGNLFNPFVPLIDADEWLMALDDEQFKYAARAITDLLNRAEDHFDADGNLVPRTEELVTRKDAHVLVEGDRLEHLSDGYRTVLAMCCDIMSAVPHVTDMTSAVGIVLVDEIGAHLHPSWKMRIVEALRRTFPAIQFAATTHEPLCLRGLIDDEAVLMRRDAPGVGDGQRRVSVREDLPSPEDMRVDQLLTSSLFGLDTTIDPELDRKFSQFYYLLGRLDRTTEQDLLVERLRNELAEHGVLGYTRRDQKIYELVDDLIAQERLLDPKRRKADREKLQRLNQRTRERVLALWRYADLSEEVSS